MFRKTVLYALALGLGSMLFVVTDAQTQVKPPAAKHVVAAHAKKTAVTHRRHAKRHHRRHLRRHRSKWAILWHRNHPNYRSKRTVRHFAAIVDRVKLSPAKRLAVQGKIAPTLARFAVKAVPERTALVAKTERTALVAKPERTALVAKAHSVSAPVTVMHATRDRFGAAGLTWPDQFTWIGLHPMDTPIQRIEGDPSVSGPAIVLNTPPQTSLKRGSVITGIRTIEQTKFTAVHNWADVAAFVKRLPDEQVVVRYADGAKAGQTLVAINRFYAPPTVIDALALQAGTALTQRLAADDAAILGLLPNRALSNGLMVDTLRTHSGDSAMVVNPDAHGAKTPSQRLMVEQHTTAPSILREPKDPGVSGQGPFSRVTADSGDGNGAVVKTAPAESSLTPGSRIIGIRTVEQTFFKTVRTWADVVEFAKGLPDDEVVVKFRDPGGAVKECNVQLFHPRLTVHQDEIQ